jgi:phosphate:Na+ symporter
MFHLGFNIALALLFIGFTAWSRATVERLLPDASRRGDDAAAPPRPARADDAVAGDHVRGARGAAPGRRRRDDAARHRAGDPQQRPGAVRAAAPARRRRRRALFGDQVLPDADLGEALSERESRRWTDIVSFTINMEQIGDIIERVLQDVEDKKIRKGRSFSDAGIAEICHPARAPARNLRLAMSVFLDAHVRDAQRLLEEKAHFRDLEHEYAANHISRLRGNTTQSIETSSLHSTDQRPEADQFAHLLDRLPILESAGALTKTRIRHSQIAELGPSSSPRRSSARADARLAGGRPCLIWPTSNCCSPATVSAQYSGEPVTQLEHALQSAHLAEQIGRR